MVDLSDDDLNAIIEHATGYDGDGTQAMNSGDLQSIARAAIAADRALNAQAAAEPMTNPNDPQWMAFMSWAQKRWGSETWRHTSNTCGEWDAWQAGRLAERAAIAAPPQQARQSVNAEGPFTPVVFERYEFIGGERGWRLGFATTTALGHSCICWI